MKKTSISHPSTPITLFAKSKKAIGPVVAIALLIVVAVSSVIGFQTFFQNYQSSLQSKVESKSQNTNVLDILYVESNIDKTIIYIKNGGVDYAILNEVKLNKNNCNLIGSDIASANDVTQISVDCLVSRNSEVEVMIMTDFGVTQEKHLAK